MKRTNHYHKYQLKDDPYSVERREWYTSMQEPFMQSYENFVHLQAIARQESNNIEEERSILTEADSKEFSTNRKESPRILLLKRSKSIVPMNLEKLLSESSGSLLSDYVALLIPGLGTSHSVFAQLVDKVFTPLKIPTYSICLAGRMHRIAEQVLPVMRLVIYHLYEELQSSLFLQHYQQQGKKLILLGYSYGALISYELFRISFNDGWRNIVGFIPISCRSPIKQSRYNIDREGQVFYHTEVNDSYLMQQMMELRAIPPFFQECKGLLKKFAPFFRQEFQLLETYLTEPPFIPGQTRSFPTIEREYFSSYYHHYFTTVTASVPSTSISTAASSFAESKKSPSASPSNRSKLISMNSAASISTVSTTSASKLTAISRQSSNVNNSAIHSMSVNVTNQTSRSGLHRKKVDEKLIQFQEEMNELLEMPTSLFKIQVPIFSISTMDDQIVPNEEDIKSWSNHSSLYHQHYIIANEGLGHYHMDSTDTIRVIGEIVHRIIHETFTSDL